MSRKSKTKTFKVPNDWSFNTPTVAAAFDAHVREQLPWYEIATGAVAHVARCFIPDYGTVIDVGASNGNVGRAIAPTLEARNAHLIAIDNSREMGKVYKGPGDFRHADVVGFDFCADRPDVVICFLSLMFVKTRDRAGVLTRMKQAMNPGGTIIVVDKIVPRGGYAATVNYRLTLAAKYEAGATPEEIIRKELSISGLQRPMSETELGEFSEFFRFGDFGGYIWEKPV